jgi:hypothetical protein
MCGYDLRLGAEAHQAIVTGQFPFQAQLARGETRHRMEIEDDAQNRDREHPVPAAVIHRMIEHWEVPDLTEAHAVECVIR